MLKVHVRVGVKVVVCVNVPVSLCDSACDRVFVCKSASVCLCVCDRLCMVGVWEGAWCVGWYRLPISLTN